MNILVTGGAGYIGTYLVPLLLAEGHTVRVLDNLIFGGEPLIPFFPYKNFEFQRGDIRDSNDVRRAVAGQDIIIHLAAIVGFPACNRYPRLAREVNVEGTKNIASVLSRDQLVFYASTGSNYGAVEGICTEETPLKPASLYGQTKTEAEQYLREHCSVITFRFATAFGISPRLRLDLLINDLVYRAMVDRYIVIYQKDARRTFIHVHDIGRSFAFGIQCADSMKGGVYNVGSEKMNYTKEEVAAIIKGLTQCEVYNAEVGVDADVRDYCVSYAKIRSLGFDTTVSLEETIKRMVDMFEVITTRSPYSNI